MKRNFLKNSLATFAFSLAIIASFAFSPNLGNEDEALQDIYIQWFFPQLCELIADVDLPADCDIANYGKPCTYTYYGSVFIVYKNRTSNTTCVDILRKAEL